jgi:hypothetical protein
VGGALVVVAIGISESRRATLPAPTPVVSAP